MCLKFKKRRKKEHGYVQDLMLEACRAFIETITKVLLFCFYFIPLKTKVFLKWQIGCFREISYKINRFYFVKHKSPKTTNIRPAGVMWHSGEGNHSCLLNYRSYYQHQHHRQQLTQWEIRMSLRRGRIWFGYSEYFSLSVSNNLKSFFLKIF